MIFSSFTSLFQKKQKSLSVPDTMLIKKLKGLSGQSDLLIYKDINIYHHSASYRVPLMAFDPHRGLYLFETKEWTYDELKNADIQKAQKQDARDNTLAFDNTQNIIRQKFNEITHSDGVPIFNYLLMENLNTDEYEHLSDTFKKLLPRDKIIFSDSLQSDIFKKLQSAVPENSHLSSVDTVLGTLFIQFAILDEKANIHLATQEQQNFITQELPLFSNLTGLSASGKSTLLLLKSLVELLDKNAEHIIILKPTLLACDILKKRLLDTIEHAIIEVDLTAIEIITPLELINRHREKLNKEIIFHIEIEDKLMKKSFHAADIIMCDDANLLPSEFLTYLKYIQKKKSLLLVNAEQDSSYTLTQSFRGEKRRTNFYKTTPHAKAMHIIARLLSNSATQILVVSNSISSEKLRDDLDSYITHEAIQLESEVALINQENSNLLLTNYTDINAIQVNHIILMDVCFLSENLLEYAFNLAKLSVDVLYEEDCQEINNLRNKYEKSSEK